MSSRKRSKPNPPSEGAGEGPSTPGSSAISIGSASTKTLPRDALTRPTSSGTAASWQPLTKSQPVTNVFQESISADLPRANTPTRSLAGRESGPYMQNQTSSLTSLISTGSMRDKRAPPVAASITKLNVTSESTPDLPNDKPSDAKADTQDAERPSTPKIDPPTTSVETPKISTPVLRETGSPWLKWISKSSEPKAEADAKPVDEQPKSNSEALKAAGPKTANGDAKKAAVAESSRAPASKPVSIPATSSIKDSDIPSQPLTPPTVKATKAQSVMSASPQDKSWFYFWKPSTEENLAAKPAEEPPKDEPVTESTPLVTKPPEEAIKAEDVGKNSSWAFWSSKPASQSSPEVGEMAVANTTSQSDPQPAGVGSYVPSRVGSLKQTGKRERPKSMEIAEGQSPKLKATVPKPSPKLDPVQSSSASIKTQAHPNLVLPSFTDTYRLVENPTILQKIVQWLQYGRDALPTKHLHIVRDPPRIRKAVAIGIHGYFPTALLLRTMIGQPTGTSLKFANMAASAIERWTADRGYSCEIEKISLEGQGLIEERVDTLWKLLLNWIDHIRQADFIMIACHSQGVPVSMMILARLIDFGCVNSARIGLCCMAGINLGPFPSLKSIILTGPAGELFEFANPKSAVSVRYQTAFQTVIAHGARICLIGALDDQAVPLESAIFTTVTHPLIYRAIYVDGRAEPPDFITHLVSLALKLRNLGVSDHGLIRELSAPLAGNLYSGDGHSRLYDDDRVYDIAMQHTIETTGIDSKVPLEINTYEPPSNNPFILPWCMRGVLEEEYVKTELYKETELLLEQFDKWKPINKALKDVKFRLEAVRSKL